TGVRRGAEVREGVGRSFVVRPEDFGMPRAAITDLLGGDREQNAEIIRGILDREQGPRRDIVLINAAAALVAGGKAHDLKEGVALAAHSIDSGAAARTLERLVAFTRTLGQET